MSMLRGISIHRVVWGLLLAAIAGCEGLDEPLYHASKNWQKTWDVGPSPEVVVESRSGGPLYVTAGSDGKVTASFQVGRVSKISQETADQAVRSSPGFTLGQEGGKIKIIESDINTAQCSVHLSVPASSRLDLRAAAGDICVGCPQAVSVTSLRARQDSVGVLTVNLLGRPGESPRLDLEGGNLRLTVDGVRVDVGPPAKYDRPGGVGLWHYHSE